MAYPHFLYNDNRKVSLVLIILLLFCGCNLIANSIFSCMNIKGTGIIAIFAAC